MLRPPGFLRRRDGVRWRRRGVGGRAAPSRLRAAVGALGLETATVLFNLVGWSYLHLRSGHRWPPDRATEAILDVALNGVRISPPAG